jgi:hypothetical protein
MLIIAIGVDGAKFLKMRCILCILHAAIIVARRGMQDVSNLYITNTVHVIAIIKMSGDRLVTIKHRFTCICSQYHLLYLIQ